MRKALVVALLVLVCMSGRPAGAADVAVIVSADVDAYREAIRGFTDTLGHRIVAEYDMEGDPDRGQAILREIQSEVKPDLIFAVGIWALQVLAKQSIELPVVYAMRISRIAPVLSFCIAHE